jgi:hypothetical protein
MVNKIKNVYVNTMGTVSFDGLFFGQRKAQDFIVYPIAEKTPVARIQSDKRCGYIDLEFGEVKLTNNQYAFANAVACDRLSADDLENLKAAIIKTASKKAGNNGFVYCDNSGAALI